MHTYIHKVKYYETDKMGITHHSNYVRWMEEAKMDFLESLGFGMVKVESMGYTSPVIGIEGQYKHTTTYDDDVRVEVTLEEYTGVKINLDYKMYNDKTGELAYVGKSSNCYVDEKGTPVRVKKISSDFDAALRNALNK